MRPVLILVLLASQGIVIRNRADTDAPSQALYVDPTHPSASDNTTRANNSPTTPWATVQRALTGAANECTTNASEAAQAGDTVVVSAGTYTESSPSVCGVGNVTPTFRPINSGSSGSRITIQCVTDRACTLRTTGGNGPTFGVEDVDYITWRGFVAEADPENGYNVPRNDTGVVTVYNCESCIFEYNTIGAGGTSANKYIWPMNPNGAIATAIAITGADGASPTVFTSASAHGALADYALVIDGHPTVPDGFYYVTTAPTGSTFTMRDGYTGAAINGISASGGTLQVTDRNTNMNALRANAATTNLIVRNNILHGAYTPGNGNNGACFMSYAATGAVLQNNTIYDCGAGIHFKGGNVGTTADDCFDCVISKNLIYNCGIQNDGELLGSCIALHVGSVASAAQPFLIYQNILRDSVAACIDYHPWDPQSAAAAPRYVYVVNNTMDNCREAIFIEAGWAAQGVIPDPAGYVVWNNIFTNMTTNYWRSGATVVAMSDKDRIDAEHNVYALFDGSVFARVDYEGTPADYTALANWTSGVSQDTATGNGGASVTTDPQYVDEAGDDFHTNAAFVQTLGVDYLDLDGDLSTTDVIPVGAYITGTETIGHQ